MRRRLDIERQTRLEPKRMQAAYKAILDAGYKPEILSFKDQLSKAIVFYYKGNKITYYAYSGWHTGKGITDGRGLKNLLKQIE